MFLDLFSILNYLFSFCQKLLNSECFWDLKMWPKFFSLKLVKSGQKIWHRLFSGKTFKLKKAINLIFSKKCLFPENEESKLNKFLALTNGKIGMGFFFRNGVSIDLTRSLGEWRRVWFDHRLLQNCEGRIRTKHSVRTCSPGKPK